MHLFRIPLDEKIETLGAQANSQGFLDLLQVFIGLSEEEICQVLIVRTKSPAGITGIQNFPFFYV